MIYVVVQALCWVAIVLAGLAVVLYVIAGATLAFGLLGLLVRVFRIAGGF